MKNSLQHVGVLGMRWGIRRRSSSSGSSKPASADSAKAASLRKKPISEMSNEELKVLTTRMQLERQYKDLSSKDHSAGSKFVSEVLTNTGKNLITTALTEGTKSVVKIVVKSVLEASKP